ncbi:MAG: hypothetical protein ACRCXD_02250 [Luteolibacter sp.]
MSSSPRLENQPALGGLVWVRETAITKQAGLPVFDDLHQETGVRKEMVWISFEWAPTASGPWTEFSIRPMGLPVVSDQ